MQFILKLLDLQFNPFDELYDVFNKKPSSVFDRSEDNKGLGPIFQVETRERFKGTPFDLTEIFHIDDEKKKISHIIEKDNDLGVNAVKKLYELSRLFEAGDKALAIKPSPRKRALLLALHLNIAGNRVKPEKFEELLTLFPHTQSVFGNPIENPVHEAIREKIRERVKVVTATGTKLDLLFSNMNKHRPAGGLKAIKQEQLNYFVNRIKGSDFQAKDLLELCEYMAKVQAKDPKVSQKNFRVVRQERFSLFGGGNTTTWQAMFSAAKQELINKLGIPAADATSKPVKKPMDERYYNRIAKAVGVHGGRWYTGWFWPTTSLTRFKKYVEPAAAVAQPTANPVSAQPQAEATAKPQPVANANIAKSQTQETKKPKAKNLEQPILEVVVVKPTAPASTQKQQANAKNTNKMFANSKKVVEPAVHAPHQPPAILAH